MLMSPEGKAGYSSIDNRGICSQILINSGMIYPARKCGWRREKTRGRKIERDKTGVVYGLTKTDGDIKERVGQRKK